MWPAMVHSFDIFRILRDDEPLRVEEALTLHDAMARVRHETMSDFTFRLCASAQGDTLWWAVLSAD
jgi:hypothetical protein